MFIIPVLCFVGGLMAMGRTKPKTVARKIVALGPRSGIVWNVEDFPEIGTVVVRAPNDRAIAQFVRASVRQHNKPGLEWQNGFGDPTLLATIRADFGVEPARPKAVNPESRVQSPGSKEKAS